MALQTLYFSERKWGGWEGKAPCSDKRINVHFIQIQLRICNKLYRITISMLRILVIGSWSERGRGFQMPLKFLKESMIKPKHLPWVRNRTDMLWDNKISCPLQNFPVVYHFVRRGCFVITNFIEPITFLSL